MEAIGLKFRFGGDKAIANSTAAMAMRGLNQMYDVYQTSRSGSISNRASLVLYFTTMPLKRWTSGLPTGA